MSMQDIKILGVPFSYGQEKEGVKLAPDYFRKSGLCSMLNEITMTTDLGNLDLEIANMDLDLNGIKKEYQSSIASYQLSNALEKLTLEDSFLLNIGGDHGLGLGVLHGLLYHRPNMVVVWADAHGDINTPTSSPSGNFHGMPLSFILNGAQNIETFSWLKRTLPANKLILFGPRSLDEGELTIIKSLNIQYYSSNQINDKGAATIIKDAIRLADPLGVCPIHLSLDVDFFDAEDIISTGTREAAGPAYNEVFSMGKALAETGRLKSMDVVELNPLIGTTQEVDATFEVAIDFIKLTLMECFKKKSILLKYVGTQINGQI